MRRNMNYEEEQDVVQPLLKLKPHFNLITAISAKHLETLLALILLGVLLVQTAGLQLAYFLGALVIYLVYLTIRMLDVKRKYKKTIYLFFEDRLYIFKKYGREEKTMIPYSDIADVLYYQNYAQKLFGMGGLGIKLRSGNFFNNIVMLESLKDLNGNIEKIKEILYVE